MNWKIGRSLLFAVPLLFAGQAWAATEFKIGSDTASVRDRVVSSGPIKVNISFDPISFDKPNAPTEDNLKYEIFYNNQSKISDVATTFYTGEVSLKDLDADGTAEVLVETFTGGAHCCTNTLIYTWRNNQFVKVDAGTRDGGGGNFVDIDDDGKLEFATFDQSFLYLFSSYAGSYPPSNIYDFKNGRLVDTTRQYPKYLRSTAWKMYQALVESKKNEGEINGILAGYVAQKALLGEFEEGWKLMLANYDRSSDWGFDIYDKNGKVIGRHPDFPSALRAHLKATGYIK
ncbi:MAG TPA: hypothetical protein IGS53_14510 [Leptolyngbyaceae cyanobacterium M33_DOE_097]|uniref:VCBS repeat-containing protein n=1 Tax=Oscillatoriales cyanobacterium SpSt-418 TaxID=2282169 RepID=A0A7C3PH90_9CYAN|nr:hypothetical protein [Leptolyngbyaceae cyanobacterium M33_DOE_097]